MLTYIAMDISLCPSEWYQSAKFRVLAHALLPFTTTFRKFRLESKWYTTFRVVPVENFREQRNVSKGSPVFPDGMFQTEIRVPFVQI